jgi:hypothetical protein
MPYTYHSALSQAGLADSTGLLNVNPKNLQHVKYDNIFGLGDVTNVPTTKTFFGGLSQVHVLRNNLEKKLKGLELNATYNGHAEAALYLGQDKLTWVSHLYDGVEESFDTSSLTASLRFKLHAKFGKSSVAEIIKFKNWGPPYYKFKKTFEGGAAAAPTTGSINVQQKTA